MQLISASARATSKVPVAYSAFSNQPSGPFQNTGLGVLQRVVEEANGLGANVEAVVGIGGGR